MKFRTRWIAAPALLLATLAGCGLGDEDGFQNEKLTEARTHWDRQDVASYSYILELECFCAPASQLRPVLATVQNGAVTSVLYWDENPAKRTPAPADVFAPYDTVEELFDVVEEAIRRDADVLQVGYDPSTAFRTLSTSRSSPATTIECCWWSRSSPPPRAPDLRSAGGNVKRQGREPSLPPFILRMRRCLRSGAPLAFGSAGLPVSVITLERRCPHEP